MGCLPQADSIDIGGATAPAQDPWAGPQRCWLVMVLVMILVAGDARLTVAARALATERTLNPVDSRILSTEVLHRLPMS